MKTVKTLAFTGLFVLVAIVGGLAQKAETNIRAAYDALGRRDFDAFIQLCAPDFVEYAAGPEPIKTPQAAVEAYKMYIAAFPDLKFQIHDIAEGEDGKYYVKVTSTGTNSGPFGMLPATGKSVSITDVDVIQVNSKKLAMSHWSANPNGMLTAIGYGSLANPSTAVVMEVYEKFSKGDVKGILASCTDDVVFEIHDDVLVHGSRTYTGKSRVADFFKELGEKNQYTKFEPWRFIADGEDVIILVNAAFTYTPDGKNYMTEYTHQFKVVDGKIKSFKGMAEPQEMNMDVMAERNIRNLFDAMDAGKSDQFPMYCAADFTISNPFMPEPSPIAAFQSILQVQKTAFPDMKHEISSMISDGQFVTTKGIFRGTNTGSMMGNPPTGNKVVVPFLCLDELDAAGKLKSRFVQFDLKSFESQLMGDMSKASVK